MWSSAPVWSARTTSSGAPREVSTIRYGEGRSPAARTFSQTSSPVRPGIIQSSTATSGPSAPLRARHASSPFATTVAA